MNNSNITLADKYLNELGNFKDSIKPIKGKTIHSIDSNLVRIKNEYTGEIVDYSKPDLNEILAFQMYIGLTPAEITNENAQSRAVEVLSLLR
ncbi:MULTISPECIES: hypothetical protein [Pseudomonas]|uniref:Uncharacterized protein n=1 Tax=Pseudomonas helleri TaxID=1608996 RepID=A0A6L5HWH6_9PSED|nr:hypothetical protein [Pseudomonas helleri]MQU07732.1 hypothetical protein [Pseudomonas helleri]